jgi:ribose 5-phosphate isomerase B
MKIAVTTDHAGFEVLRELKRFLISLGHECVDFGPKSLNVDDDYPDFMFPAAQAVAGGECERGIILGGSGQGEAMAANRVKGVRCALFYGPVVAKTAVDAEGTKSNDPYEIVKLSRQHNDANVLSLSGRFLSLEEMKQAVTTWLETPFSGIERHSRRIKKLDELVS